MALQFEAKSSGTAFAKTRSNPKYKDNPTYADDKDWDPKMEEVDVNAREVKFAGQSTGYERPDPVTDLKNRLSMWGEDHNSEYNIMY